LHQRPPMKQPFCDKKIRMDTLSFYWTALAILHSYTDVVQQSWNPGTGW